MLKLQPKSKQVQFLLRVLEELKSEDKPKHPVLAVLLGQVYNLLLIIDSKEGYQQKVTQALNFIKENWKE